RGASLSAHPPPAAVLSFSHASGAHPDLHSFPTRRSSDLLAAHLDDLGMALAREPLGDPRDAQRVLGHDLADPPVAARRRRGEHADRKSTRLNSSHVKISYAVFCLKKKKKLNNRSHSDNN